MQMEELNRYTADPTKRTPRIVLEPGRIFILGRSIPENPGDFYRPVYDWISNYAAVNGNKTTIELGFEYINTSSTKWIYNIIKLIAGMKNLAKSVKILWYYDQGDDEHSREREYTPPEAHLRNPVIEDGEDERCGAH